MERYKIGAALVLMGGANTLLLGLHNFSLRFLFEPTWFDPSFLLFLVPGCLIITAGIWMMYRRTTGGTLLALASSAFVMFWLILFSILSSNFNQLFRAIFTLQFQVLVILGVFFSYRSRNQGEITKFPRVEGVPILLGGSVLFYTGFFLLILYLFFYTLVIEWFYYILVVTKLITGGVILGSAFRILNDDLEGWLMGLVASVVVLLSTLILFTIELFEASSPYSVALVIYFNLIDILFIISILVGVVLCYRYYIQRRTRRRNGGD